MKLGARAHDFGRMSVAELNSVIKNAGFEAIQLAPTKAITGIKSFDDISMAVIDEILRVFENSELEIGIWGCYIEPSLEDKEKRLSQVEIFNSGLKNAKLLNVPIVGTETTHFPIDSTENEREKAYLRLKDSVMRMTETAERVGTDIGIEPVAEHVLNSSALARRLLDEVGSKRLKVILDPVNLLLPATANNQDEIFADFLDILGNDIAAVHLKDITVENGEKTWKNIGAGIVNYGQVFDWLKRNKPDICVFREGIKPESFQVDMDAMRCLMR